MTTTQPQNTGKPCSSLKYCSKCGNQLEEDQKISIGIYGVRGVYCSHLCSYLQQPGQSQKTKAKKELKKETCESGRSEYIQKDLEALKQLHQLAIETFNNQIEELRTQQFGKQSYITKIKIHQDN